jgi:hypothetical protein
LQNLQLFRGYGGVMGYGDPIAAIGSQSLTYDHWES